jgi:hypothetical protein
MHMSGILVTDNHEKSLRHNSYHKVVAQRSSKMNIYDQNNSDIKILKEYEAGNYLTVEDINVRKKTHRELRQ